MRIAPPLLVVAILALAPLGGCGEDAERPAATDPAPSELTPTDTTPTDPAPAEPMREVRLELRYDDGEGEEREASLTCAEGEAAASGYLEDARPAELCRRALALDELLTEQPPEKQVCTQIYGGPQTARVTGTLAGEEVDRRLNRENGCRIAEWDRLQRAGLLPGP